MYIYTHISFTVINLNWKLKIHYQTNTHPNWKASTHPAVEFHIIQTNGVAQHNGRTGEEELSSDTIENCILCKKYLQLIQIFSLNFTLISLAIYCGHTDIWCIQSPRGTKYIIFDTKGIIETN